jgi:glycerophosphoryl diester phosphodiesterase
MSPAARRRAGPLAAALALLLLPLASRGEPPLAPNPWLERRVLHGAHGAGYREEPENTVYAMKKAVQRGADLLEMDLRISSDGEIMVIHDTTVNRNTNGTGFVHEKTVAELTQLDAAYDFSPASNTVNGALAGTLPYRGIGLGSAPPPPGYTRSDFTIPTLAQVLATFPDVLLDMEIKEDGPPELHAATAKRLAELLHAFGRSNDVLVTSFSDELLASFKTLAPEMGTSPGTNETAEFFFYQTPMPHHVALQVPREYFGLNLVNKTVMANARNAGLAFIVFVYDDDEFEPVYARIVDAGAQGMLVGVPSLFERMLEERGVVFRSPVSVSRPRVTAWLGALELDVACPAEQVARCQGDVLVDAPGLYVGRGRVDLARGASGTVRIALSYPARLALLRNAAIGATVRVTPRNGSTAGSATPIAVPRPVSPSGAPAF